MRGMQRLRVWALGLVAMLAAPASWAVDVAVTPGTDWYEFRFAEAGSPWSDDNGDPITFNFTLLGASWLSVVDGGFSGDRFGVVVNGSVIGSTSAPVEQFDDNLGSDYLAASADPRFSSGRWLLGAGTYAVTGTAIDSPLFAGSGGLNVSAVPEPAPLALAAVGLALLLTYRRVRTSGADRG